MVHVYVTHPVSKLPFLHYLTHDRSRPICKYKSRGAQFDASCQLLLEEYEFTPLESLLLGNTVVGDWGGSL